MAVSRRSGRSGYQRRSEGPGPWLYALLILAAGGGGGYYYLLQQKQLVKAEKTAEETIKKVQAQKTSSTTTVPKEVEKKNPLEELKVALNSLLENAQYKSILSRLDGIAGNNVDEKAETTIEKMREKTKEHAQKRFEEDMQKVEAQMATKNPTGALALLNQIQEYGIEGMAAEAGKKVTQIQATQRSTELFAQIEAYTNINAALTPSLREYNYAAAGPILDQQAAMPQNQAFANDLLAMKDDFKAVQSLWGDFLKKTEEDVGTEAVFGAKQGKISAIRDGAVVVDVSGTEETFRLKDMQPKWIELRMELSSTDPDPEKWYAISLLYLHKGRDNEAAAIFKRLGDAHPGVARQVRWMSWADEIQAKAKLEELKQAGEEKRHSNVREMIDEVREDYGSTRVYKLQESMVQEFEQQANGALKEVQAQIDERTKSLDTMYERKKAEIETWYNGKKGLAQAQYEKDMMDPVTYQVIEDEAVTVSRISPTAGTGADKTGIVYRFGYIEVARPTSKKANLDALDLVLRTKKTEGKADMLQKKRVKEFRRQLAAEIRRAESRASENMTKLKDMKNDKLGDLRNRYLRLRRKLRGGELFTDEQLKQEIEGQKGEPAGGATPTRAPL